MLLHIIIFGILFVILGTGVGILSALFGLGGGLVIVPVLYLFFHVYQKMPLEIVMHVALGTSMATMLLTTINSFYGHAKKKNIVWPMVRVMGVFVALGAIVATIVVHWLNSGTLRVLFIGLLIFILGRALFKKDFSQTYTLADFDPPALWVTRSLSFFVGLIAVLVGIGGSVITLPFLRKHKMPMKNASGVAIALTPVVAILGTIGYLIAGLRYPGHLPPDCFGFINLPAFLGIGAGTLMGVPIGVRLTHVLSDKTLGRGYLYLLGLMVVLMLV